MECGVKRERGLLSGDGVLLRSGGIFTVLSRSVNSINACSICNNVSASICWGVVYEDVRGLYWCSCSFLRFSVLLFISLSVLCISLVVAGVDREMLLDSLLSVVLTW